MLKTPNQPKKKWPSTKPRNVETQPGVPEFAQDTLNVIWTLRYASEDERKLESIVDHVRKLQKTNSYIIDDLFRNAILWLVWKNHIQVTLLPMISSDCFLGYKEMPVVAVAGDTMPRGRDEEAFQRVVFHCFKGWVNELRFEFFFCCGEPKPTEASLRYLKTRFPAYSDSILVALCKPFLKIIRDTAG